MRLIGRFRLMLSLLQGKGYLLCLDNAHLIEHDDLAPTFIDLLERECKGGGISALLISEGATGLLLTVQPLKLEGFSVDETKSLCELHGLTMSETLIAELHRKTGGNPRLLTSACLALSRTTDIGQQIDELPEDVIDFSSLGRRVDEGLNQKPQLIDVMMAMSLLMENPEIAGVSVGAVEALVERGDTPRLLLRLFDLCLVRGHSTRFTSTYTLDERLRRPVSADILPTPLSPSSPTGAGPMTNRSLPPRLLLDIDRFLAAQPFHPCCLLVHPSTAHLRDLGHALAEHYGWPRISPIDLLVELLIDAPVDRRPSLARDEVLAAATRHSPGPVLLADIDLLFEPSLRLDPLRLFLDASRHAQLVVTWPGDWSNSALAYAQPAHAHYRVWRNPELCPQCVIRV